MKHLVELSKDDLETLRTMSKRFPNRNRNAETPEELLMPPVKQENRTTVPHPGVVGIMFVACIVAGIFALIGLVDFVWRLLTR